MVYATHPPIYSQEKITLHVLYRRLGGSRAGLDEYGKSFPHWDSIPESSSPYRVYIPTTLSQSPYLHFDIQKTAITGNPFPLEMPDKTIFTVFLFYRPVPFPFVNYNLLNRAVILETISVVKTYTCIVVFCVMIPCSLVCEYPCFGEILLTYFGGIFYCLTEQRHFSNIMTLFVDVFDTSNKVRTSMPVFTEVRVAAMHEKFFELRNIKYTSIENRGQNINWLVYRVFNLPG